MRDSNLLFQSIILGKNELLGTLIENGADLKHLRGGMTALQIAVIAGNREAVDLLLKHGATDSSSDRSARYYAELLGRADLLDKLPKRQGEVLPTPFAESEIKEAMQKIPASLLQSIHTEFSLSEKHTALAAELAPEVYAPCSRKSEFPPFQTRFQQVASALEKAKTIGNEPLIAKYETLAKRLENGEPVQLPYFSRSLDFDLLKQHAETGQISYAHRGSAGLWTSTERESHYGDYTIWFSQDIQRQSICSTDIDVSKWMPLANSIDWSQVVQISCPADKREEVEKLLQSNRIRVPVVSQKEADLEQTLLENHCLTNKNSQRLQTVSCPLDDRVKKNTFGINIDPGLISVLLYSAYIIWKIYKFDPESDPLKNTNLVSFYYRLTTGYSSLVDFGDPMISAINSAKTNSQKAKLIRAWFETENSKRLCEQVTTLTFYHYYSFSEIPSEIRYLTNLRELTIENEGDPQRHSLWNIDRVPLGVHLRLTNVNIRTGLYWSKKFTGQMTLNNVWIDKV